MKRYFLILVSLLLLANIYVLAQVQQEEDEPLPPKRNRGGKIGGAGGFTPGFLFFDFAPINQYLSNANAAKLSDGPLALYGGTGYAYIMLVENLRVGGIGMAGTRTSKALDPTTNTRRDVDYHIGYGGVTVEYVFPIKPRFDVTAGVMLGGGGVDIKMTRNINGTKVWNDLWNEFGDPNATTDQYSRKLTGTFFIYQPQINVEYAITRWIGVRVGVSYLGMAGSSWQMDDNYDVTGVPGDVKGEGFMLNTGLFIGTFLF